MSSLGPGGGPGSATSYSSLRRGIKATTSKLMNATSSVKRPGSMPAPPSERSITERSDPGRFVEGVSFKGKLIGVLEVAEARGDRMCQEALGELKIAVRAAGEHKQRIAISVAMDGIRLRDERTGDCLYHHPVHKISFIAQDMTDTRAFGYIFGSPDAGHKFFGIKTEKSASQVVIAMRDLFQVVFELKKKEIEKAKAQLREGSSAEFKDDHFDPFGDSFKPGGAPEAVPKPPRSAAATPAPLAPPPISGRIRHDTQSLKLQHQHSLGKGDFAKFPVDFKNLNQNPSSQVSERKDDRYAVFKELHPGRDEASAEVFQDERGETHRKSVGSASSADSYAKNDEFDTEWILIEPNVSQGSQASGYDVFTELDPLGTGKVRPFVDKKDFFNDVRKATARRLLRELGDGEESQPGSPRVPPGIIPADVSALVASSSLYCATGIPSSSGNTLMQQHASTHTTPIHGTALASHASESFSPTQNSLSDGFPSQSLSRERLDNSSGFADFNQFADSPRSQRSDFSGSNFDEPPTSLSVGSLTVALPPESFRDSPPPFSPPPPPRFPSRSTSGSNSPQPPRHRHSPVQQAKLMKQITVAASPVSPKTLPRNHRFYRQISHDSDLDGRVRYLNLQHRDVPDAEIMLSSHDGGISPRPRPRSSLSKLLSSSSATLPLRSSQMKRADFTRMSLDNNDIRPFLKNDNIKLEEAPEPPPRPAHVEPPPLPPKRLPSHITLRPPPRPPPSADPQYIYINDYDSSPDDFNVKSPPIPVPARKLRYTDSSQRFASDRVSKTQVEGFQFPKTSHSPTRELTGAVPKTSSRGSISSKSSTPGKSPRSGTRPGISPSSVDLTNTSLDQLAFTLDIPVDQLAKMTVVELAACLAQVQLRHDSTGNLEDMAVSHSNLQEFENLKERRSRKTSADWAQDRFRFDEDEMFAKFDEQFPKSPVNTPTLPGFPTSSSETTTPKFPLGAPVSEDRYAVFKELSSTGKQKSVFDENFLTPQNSMEEEISEVSSGTFKANFADDFYHDSLEQKSSISDEIEAVEGTRNKEWDPCERIDHECVTVFRSPDISEYENFEPNFEGKFEDDFSAASLSERSNTPINSPAHVIQPTFSLPKKPQNFQKSPFTDDFSKASVSAFREGRATKISNDDKFSANFNERANTSLSDRGSVSSECEGIGNFARQNSVHKSPFEDNFSEYISRSKVSESDNLSNLSFDRDKYEILDNGNTKGKRLDSNQRTKKSRPRKHSLDAPSGSFNEKCSSPFDDDFIRRTDRYEVLRDLDNDREPSLEGEVCKLTKDDIRVSPFDDSWHGSPRVTPYDDQKSIGSLHSIQEESRNHFFNSPFEGLYNRATRKESGDLERVSRCSSDLRKSPYSESFALNQSGGRSRGPSRVSLGSEGSGDIRQSPFDDCFQVPQQQQTLPTESKETPQNGTEINDFADFENAFHDASEELPPKGEDAEPPGGEEEDAEEEEGVFPEVEPEFKVSARFAKTSVEDASIFRRESDPFADDFFMEDKAKENSSSAKAKEPKDSFWQEPFDNYTFAKNC